MPSQSCPTRETLQNYLNGKLDDESSKVLDQHLLDCEVCEQTATNLESDPDTMVEILAQHVVPELSHSENLIESLQRLQAIRKIDSAGEAKSEIITKIGGYAILARLGRGGMGNVYLAQHQQLGKQVALKVLPALLAKNPDALARFQREMRAVGKLDHATIVRATDAGQSDGYHFLVMERVQGLDVSQVARHCGPLSSADAAEIVRQAALGLSYAHAQGIVHRDIKPSNLMLGGDGNIKILDFGLAQISLWEEGAAEITTVGQLMGTLDYMAPEQAERQGAVDYRADLYSLGATLFRLLTGRAPLAASPHLTPLEKLRLLNEFSPPKIQTLRSDLSEGMCKIVAELLEHNPSKRPASAAHVAERLAALAQGANLQALLNQADRKMDQASDSDDELAQIAPKSEHSPEKVQPQTASMSGRIGRIMIGLATCMLPIAIIAGVMLVVEMQKGQLIIKSETANVKVKIVSDQEQSHSVQIVPGTQSTKLKAGKYEIELESPSDSYSLDKSQFTIKNGEIVVATIGEKDTVQTAANATAVSPSSNDFVYLGKNVDTWLSILQFEASSNERAEASTAIEKIVNRQNQTRIRERILEILRTNPNREAFSILPRVAKGQFFAILTDLLEKEDNQARLDLIDWTGASYASINPDAFDHIDPYLDWLDSKAIDTSNDGKLVSASANFFEYALFRSDVSLAAHSKIIDHVNRWPQITVDNFWLKDIDELGEKFWSPALYEAVIHRIQSVLADEKSSDISLAKATITANFIARKNRSVVENAIKADVASIKSRLAMETKDIEHAIKIVMFGGPHGGVYEHYVNPAVELVKLLQATDQGQLFQDELRKLHDAIPLEQVHVTINYLSEKNRFQTPEDRELKYTTLKFENTIFIDVINTDKLYTISGKLIGISDDEIKSKLYPAFAPGDTIRVGDTLSIHIPGLTPLGKPDHQVVLQAGNQAPVTGLPFQVANDGSVILPQVGKVAVVDKSLDQARDTIISSLGNSVTEAQKKSVQVHFLMYVNQSQEVRRIIDPEIDRSVGMAEPAAAQSAANAVLKENVYDGKNLDAWLHVLEFESEQNRRRQAADAVLALANQSDQEVVLQRVIAAMKKLPDENAAKILTKFAGDKFFEIMTDLLQNASADDKVQLIHWSFRYYQLLAPAAFERIDMLLNWLDSELSKPSNESLNMMINGFAGTMLRNPDISKAVQAKVAAHADRWPQLTDDFWLHLGTTQPDTACSQRVLKRVSRIIENKQSPPDVLIRATSAANQIATHGDLAAVSSMIDESASSISQLLQSATKDFHAALQLHEVAGRKQPASVAEELLVLLQVANKGPAFKNELTAFHTSIAVHELKDYFTSMAESSRAVDFERFVKEMKKIQANNAHTQDRATTFELYWLSGHLIGKSSEELKAAICPADQGANSIWVGDVLAIYVLGVTQPIQGNERPILLQAGNHPPVQGSPFEVLSDGTVNLLTLGKISVAGKTIDQAKDVVVQQASKVLAKDIVRFVEVNFLMLSNQREEIRQILGPQMEAGNNVPIENGASTEVSPAKMRRASNPLLNEAVYDGKTLSAWFEILEFEKNGSEQVMAANAVSQFINSKNREEILRHIVKILQNDPRSGAIRALPVAAEDQYFIELVKLLQNADDKGVQSLIFECKYAYNSIDKAAFENIDPFLDWMDAVLRDNPDKMLVQRALELFAILVFEGQVSESVQTKVIDHVKTWPQFTDTNFWLNQFPYSEEPWTTSLCTIEIERIKDVLQDSSSDMVLVAKSLALANFIATKRLEIVAAAIDRHPAIIDNWLSTAASNFERMFKSCEVDRSRSRYERSSSKLNPLLLTFDLLKETKKAGSFQNGLASVYNAIPIKEVKVHLAQKIAQNRYPDLATLKQEFMEGRHEERLISIKNAYGHCGELLGKSAEQLDSEIYPPIPNPDLIRSGDVLAIHIMGLTPMSRPDEPAQTIVLQAGSKAPVKGLPFTVNQEGKVGLPILGEFEVSDMTPSQAQKAILDAYIKAEVYTNQSVPGTDVQVAFLTYAGSRAEIRQIVGPATELPRREEGKGKN